MLYLAPYEGTGTRPDPFRPKGARRFAHWGAVDLRPDPTKPDGYALFLPPTTADLSGCIKIGDAKDEAMASVVRTQLGNRLSLDLSGLARLEDVVADLLFTDTKPWGFVRPNWRGEKYVYVGGQQWAFKQVARPRRGELIDPTDDFNRANENPIAGDWTTGFNGWGSLRIVSNELTGASAGDNAAAAYNNAFTPQNDQFSEVTAGTALGANKDICPMVRMATGAQSGYYASTYDDAGVGFWETRKWVTGSDTTVEALTSGTAVATGDVVRVEVEGTTIRHIVRTVETTGSPSTDVSLASGRAGAYLHESAAQINAWQAGDLGAATDNAKRLVNSGIINPFVNGGLVG